MTQVNVEPVPVRVLNHPEPVRYEVRATYRTIVLTSVNPYQQVAGYDPLRECVRFTGHTNGFTVCGSIQQASDPNNAVNPPTAANGRFIPAGATQVEFETRGQNELWFAGYAFPTVIGLEIIRKVPE